MPLTDKQIAELNTAASRVSGGTASQTDIANLEYAKKTFGFSPTITTKPTATPVAPSPQPTATPPGTVVGGPAAAPQVVPGTESSSAFDRGTLEKQGYSYLGTMDDVRNAILQYGNDAVQKIGGGYYVRPNATPTRSQQESQGYQYLGTMDQVNAAIRQYGKDRVKLIGGNYYITPTGLTAPQPGQPIPAGKLGPQQQLQQILGTNIPLDSIPSDIAGLLALSGQTTESEKQYDALTQQLIELQRKAGQQGQDLQAELDRQGVGAAFQQVKELNLKAAQLQGELEKFDVATETAKSSIEDQAIPTGLISGQKAQLQKQRDLTRLAKASELSSTVALSQAYQGNAQLGLELAQKAIDIKYQPLINEIETLKTQIGFAGEKMNKEDTKRSGIISALLDLKMDELNQQREKEKQISDIAIQAAANGAPLDIVNAMMKATSATEATRLGQRYISGTQGNIEQLAATAAMNGAPQSVIAAMKKASDIADTARIGGSYLKGNLESLSGSIPPGDEPVGFSEWAAKLGLVGMTASQAQEKINAFQNDLSSGIFQVGSEGVTPKQYIDAITQNYGGGVAGDARAAIQQFADEQGKAISGSTYWFTPKAGGFNFYNGLSPITREQFVGIIPGSSDKSSSEYQTKLRFVKQFFSDLSNKEQEKMAKQ